LFAARNVDNCGSGNRLCLLRLLRNRYTLKNVNVGIKHNLLLCLTVGEEDIHAYDLSRLQKPMDQDVESVGTSVKKWPDLSLTRPGQSVSKKHD